MALATQERDRRDVVAAVRNVGRRAEIIHLQEGDHLVERAFGVQLELRMLVGHAQGLDRGLTGVAGLAVEGHVLAEGLRPQLRIPVRHQLQAVGIRHHDGHIRALFEREHHQSRIQQRRILEYVVGFASLVHIARAGQHRADIDVANRRRNQTHRAQLGEASAHAVRNIEGLEALALRDLDQEAPGFRGGDQDVLLPIVAARRLQRVGHDQVLAHRFRRAAGLGDHIEARLLQVDHVHQRRHALRIDVVLNVKARAVALFSGQLVVMQMIQRRLNRRRAERAAADAEHDERLELAADFLRGLFDLGNDCFLIIGQIHPALHILAAAGFHRRVSLLHRGNFRVQLGAGNAAGTDVFSHHRIDIQTNLILHAICLHSI